MTADLADRIVKLFVLVSVGLFLYKRFRSNSLKKELNVAKDANVNSALTQQAQDIQTEIKKDESVNTHVSEAPDQLTKDLNKI